MSYLISNEINLYPTALRGGTDITGQVYDPESRLGTEFNLTNAVNRITIDGSFVISHSGNILEFSIHGYYFRIKSVSSLISNFTSDNKIYANIRIKELAQDNYKLKSLVCYEDGSSTNLDVDDGGTSEFKGINFTNSAQGDNINTFSLEILRKVDGSWVVPDTSILKIDTKSIMVDDSRSEDSTPLSEVVYKDNQNKIHVDADEFSGHLTGNVTGNLTGNADTATDTTYASKIGSSSMHPQIGGPLKPIYVNANGQITQFSGSGSTAGSYNQPVYLNGGSITPAFKVTISTSGPTISGNEQEGDIWFQYID